MFVEADNFEFVVSWAKRVASIWDVPFSLTVWANLPLTRKEGFCLVCTLVNSPTRVTCPGMVPLLPLIAVRVYKPYGFWISGIEDLYNSVQILHNGRIPYRFVSHRKLREGLRVLKQQLKLHHSDLVIAVENLNYYYKNSDFYVFRYSRQLIISLHVPLTLKSLLSPLNLVKFQKIPIINPHENTHYTKLT